MEHKEYNGWYNYETWCVALWMDNDQGVYEYFRYCVREYDGDVRAVAEQIEQWHKDVIDELDLPNCFASDLLGGAMSEVNWDEIAENLVEDMRE